MYPGMLSEVGREAQGRLLEHRCMNGTEGVYRKQYTERPPQCHARIGGSVLSKSYINYIIKHSWSRQEMVGSWERGLFQVKGTVWSNFGWRKRPARFNAGSQSQDEVVINHTGEEAGMGSKGGGERLLTRESHDLGRLWCFNGRSDRTTPVFRQSCWWL